MGYYVYILASRKDGATYIGVTSDIVRRIYQHRTKAVPGFTSRYNITRLVWFEIYDDPISAISREKELKKWKRAWKTQLIAAQNPAWDDLYESICNQGWSFRDGPKDRTRILEIPGSRFRAPRNDITPSRRAAIARRRPSLRR
jgi:putative endonuclease